MDGQLKGPDLPATGEEPIISYQSTMCDYKGGDELVTLNEFGGDYKVLNNGSMECSLSNKPETLACMAIMKYVNSTDEYGNFNIKLHVSTKCKLKLHY